MPVSSPWSVGLFLVPLTALYKPGGPAVMSQHAAVGSSGLCTRATLTADENLDVGLLGFRHHRLEQLLGDKTLALGPPLGRLVERVERAELPRVVVLHRAELFAQEDVVFRDVAEHERDFGLVVGVLEDVPDDLVHGRDARAAGDHDDVVMFVFFDGVFRDGSFDVEALTGRHFVEMLGHGAVGVLLDDEVHVAAFL